MPCTENPDVVQTVVLIYLCSTSKLPNDLLDLQPTFHPSVHPISAAPQVGSTWGGKNSEWDRGSNCYGHVPVNVSPSLWLFLLQRQRSCKDKLQVDEGSRKSQTWVWIEIT